MRQDPQVDPDNDPRCRPDAYISLLKNLYEVIGWEGDGAGGMLHVRNSKTLFPLKLKASEVLAATLELPAPEVPAAVPDGLSIPLLRASTQP
jgi:hypothetical protein